MKEGKRFVKWPCEFNQLGLSHTEKVFLLGLLSFTNKSGNAWPSLAKLQDATGLGSTSLKRAIASLVDLGVLQKSRSEFGTNSYQVAPEEILEKITPRTKTTGDQVNSPKASNQKNQKRLPLDHTRLSSSPDTSMGESLNVHRVTSIEIELDPKNKIHEQEKEISPCIPHGENRQADLPEFASVTIANRVFPLAKVDDSFEPFRPDPQPADQPTPIPPKTPETGQGLTIIPPNESESGKPEKIQPRALKRAKPTEEQLAASRAVWNEYSAQFERRYGTPPDRPSAKENSQVKQLIAAVGVEWALHLVAYYLHTDHAFYVRACHPFGMIVSDRHKLSTELKSGKRVFYTDSIEAEKKQRSQQHVQTDWDEIEDPFETEEETRARHARLEAKKNARRTNLLR